MVATLVRSEKGNNNLIKRVSVVRFVSVDVKNHCSIILERYNWQNDGYLFYTRSCLILQCIIPQEHTALLAFCLCSVYTEVFDEKLSLLNLVSFCTHWFLFQGCERNGTSPWLWEHPLCCVIVVAGDLGSSLKAFCQCRFLQAHSRVVLAENSLNLPRQSQQGRRVQVLHWNWFSFCLKSKVCFTQNGSL